MCVERMRTLAGRLPDAGAQNLIIPYRFVRCFHSEEIYAFRLRLQIQMQVRCNEYATMSIISAVLSMR